MKGGASAVRSLIFDFDDTLIVSRTDRALLLIEALDAFGTPPNSATLDEAWGSPFRELVAALAPEAERRFPEFLAHYADRVRRTPAKACPGVAEVIPKLASVHRLFVHSSSQSLLVRTDLESLGLLSYFEFVCGSDWQSHPKPSPRSLDAIRALTTAGAEADRACWYVGDSAGDVELAAADNLTFVGVAYTPGDRERLMKFGAREEALISSMAELPALLDRESR